MFAGARRRLATYGALTLTYAVAGSSTALSAVSSASVASIQSAITAQIQITYPGVTTSVTNSPVPTLPAGAASSPSNLAAGPIAGIVIAAIILLIIIGVAIKCVFFRTPTVTKNSIASSSIPHQKAVLV